MREFVGAGVARGRVAMDRVVADRVCGDDGVFCGDAIYEGEEGGLGEGQGNSRFLAALGMTK